MELRHCPWMPLKVQLNLRASLKILAGGAGGATGASAGEARLPVVWAHSQAHWPSGGDKRRPARLPAHCARAPGTAVRFISAGFLNAPNRWVS